MHEDIIFRRRNRLKKHFVNVSNVLLYCYAVVSDAAKITFQVIDGFDWESKETGESKGYVFPAIETIAKIRHTSVRTIQRHILELIQAQLLTRIRQRNKPSILYIEEVSDTEVEKYFQFFDSKEQPRNEPQVAESSQSRNDKNVVSHKAPATTKMSFAYMKENERKENEINVNENFQIAETKKRSGMQGIRDIMTQFGTQPSTRKKHTAQQEKPEEINNATFLLKKLPTLLAIRKA